ncbi:MAG: hypothetical protein R2764_22010 [Bacteroidales bacterium]
MKIIADKRIPVEALTKLAEYGKVIEFSTQDIAYESISCHPDIFFCQVLGQLIIAPNLPEKYKTLLSGLDIPFTEGEFPVGYKHPETAGYNVVCTDTHLIHNFRYTDPIISRAAEDLDLIHVNQGYSRCNILALKDEHFITSDASVFKTFNYLKKNVLYVDPKEILLPGKDHGFFGGACGIFENKVFIIGSLAKYREGEKVKAYLHNLNYEITELYDGPLFDGGSLIFL